MSSQNAFDVFKRIAIQEIISTTGVSINSEHMLDKLRLYIQYGNQDLVSISSLYEPSYNKISLSDLSAKYTLVFLELYAQYVINAGNSETISNLSKLSRSKYEYIVNKFIDLQAKIKEKSYTREYKYVNHINFSIIKKVTNSITESIYDSSLPTLAYNYLLTLPLLSTEELYPEYTTAYIEDSITGDIDYITDNQNVQATIKRNNNLFIGTIKSTQYTSIAIQDSSLIKFSGVIEGHLSDLVYFRIVSVDTDDDLIINITYQTSINGREWDYTGFIDDIQLNAKYDIYILDSIRTGILFEVGSFDIKEDQSWILNIKYIRLPNASCNIKSIFNITKPISFISFTDLSEFKLDIDSNVKISLAELNKEYKDIKLHSNSMRYLIPTNSSAYSVDIKTTQKKHSLGALGDGQAYIKYEFDISDIVAYSNKYYKSGVMTLDAMPVEDISTIIADSNYALSENIIAGNISKAQILYIAVLESDHGLVEIPIIHQNYKFDYPERVDEDNNTCYVVEPIIKSPRDYPRENNDIMLFDLKYTYKAGLLSDSKLLIFNPLNIVDLSDFYDYADFIYDTDHARHLHKQSLGIISRDRINSHFFFYHAVPLRKIQDISLSINDKIGTETNYVWIKASEKIYYMYYIDIDNKIKTAIKVKGDNGELLPFTGNIYGKVIMYSADQNHVSPYLSDLTFGAI